MMQPIRPRTGPKSPHSRSSRLAKTIVGASFTQTLTSEGKPQQARIDLVRRPNASAQSDVNARNSGSILLLIKKEQFEKNSSIPQLLPSAGFLARHSPTAQAVRRYQPAASTLKRTSQSLPARDAIRTCWVIHAGKTVSNDTRDNFNGQQVF
jgi:hypothetical protein